jgi:hypothetical protein
MDILGTSVTAFIVEYRTAQVVPSFSLIWMYERASVDIIPTFAWVPVCMFFHCTNANLNYREIILGNKFLQIWVIKLEFALTLCELSHEIHDFYW